MILCRPQNQGPPQLKNKWEIKISLRRVKSVFAFIRYLIKEKRSRKINKLADKKRNEHLAERHKNHNSFPEV